MPEEGQINQLLNLRFAFEICRPRLQLHPHTGSGVDPVLTKIPGPESQLLWSCAGGLTGLGCHLEQPWGFSKLLSVLWALGRSKRP